MQSILRHCRSLLLALLACTAGIGGAGAAPLRVIHPQAESHLDAREGYPLAVLKLALERSGRPYRLQAGLARVPQSRRLRLVAAGEHLDIAWSVTSAARERSLRPIRIPIDRGLIGWRVLLIRRGTAHRFSAITSVAQLAPRLGAQGHDWPDLPILRSNGLRIAASPTYEGLFAMLARGHIDYVPRSVAEVGDELASRRDLPIEIEQTLLLRYPSALYFFVHPDNRVLAQAIETGMERAIRDGSLQRLFDATYGPTLAALDLDNRRVLTLHNPDLPAATPLARRALWFDPTRGR